MRRNDSEVTDINDILDIIGRCDVCRIGLNDGDTPYIVPLNFGFEYSGGQLTLFFHCAKEGKKLDLIRNCGRAAFEMDCNHELRYVTEKCMCTMAYESVMGRGDVYILAENDRARALDLIMKKYHPAGNAEFNPATVSVTECFALKVTEISAKRRK